MTEPEQCAHGKTQPPCRFCDMTPPEAPPGWEPQYGPEIEAEIKGWYEGWMTCFNATRPSYTLEWDEAKMARQKRVIQLDARWRQLYHLGRPPINWPKNTQHPGEP